MKICFLALVLGILLVSGCVAEIPNMKEQAKEKCIEACKTALATGQNLSPGPCLSNRIVDGWVCDVAHWPRQEVDNDAANQCPEFGETAKHFVEVNPECEFIRAV